jgi:hypothetical protein
MGINELLIIKCKSKGGICGELTVSYLMQLIFEKYLYPVATDVSVYTSPPSPNITGILANHILNAKCFDLQGFNASGNKASTRKDNNTCRLERVE